MNFKIIGATKPQHIPNKNETDLYCGKIGGVCYMNGTFESLLNEPEEKTQKRISATMGSGHHSVYEHAYITLELEGIPKLFAMVLNNEKVYVTSEKSARYTKMECEGKEKELYEKWVKIFEEKIKEKYKNNGFMTDTRITKLAQENARYLLSVKTPTTMVYTVSYRQLNYLCKWFENELNNPNSKYKLIHNSFKEFIKFAKDSNLIDERLQNDGKFRQLSLINENKRRSEIFDDVYSVNYVGTFAELAQAQRHRTLKYEINKIKENEFYVPKILTTYDELIKEWKEDMNLLKENLPQGTLLDINERGTYEDFILKCKERLCSFAQLEINEQTKNTLLKYLKETSNNEIAKDLMQRTKGSRCTFPDYKCQSPCNFKEGIIGERGV